MVNVKQGVVTLVEVISRGEAPRPGHRRGQDRSLGSGDWEEVVVGMEVEVEVGTIMRGEMVE